MADRAQLVPPAARAAGAHKGTFGRILVLAGSRAMPGAAILTANGALRGGAGLVTLAVPLSAIPAIAPAAPCATFLPLEESARGAVSLRSWRALRERAEAADVVALGPGLGTERWTVALVRRFTAALGRPLVIDADGLNALAGEPQALLVRSAPTVLTPHPGEMARLDGQPIPQDDGQRRRRAEDAARCFRAIVCLKGHGTVVTDGEATRVNQTGNPSMASGGAGDVLTGVVAAFLAQYDDPLQAAIAAVHVHGLAGDLAAEHQGPVSVVATDLLDHLGPAIQRFTSHP